VSATDAGGATTETRSHGEIQRTEKSLGLADLKGFSVSLCLRGKGPGLYYWITAQTASSDSLPCLWLAHFIPKSASQSTPEVRSPIACGWRRVLSKL